VLTANEVTRSSDMDVFQTVCMAAVTVQKLLMEHNLSENVWNATGTETFG